MAMTHERCVQFNRFMIEVMGTHSLSHSLKRKKDFSGLFVSRVHLAPGEVHVEVRTRRLKRQTFHRIGPKPL